MNRPLPNQGTRVAQPRSEVIPAGDALPSTHTNHTATPDPKVTVTFSGRPPRPVAALPIPAVPAVLVMVGLVLIVSVNAVLTVARNDPHGWLFVVAFLAMSGVWCVLLGLLAVAVRTRRRQGVRSLAGPLVETARLDRVASQQEPEPDSLRRRHTTGDRTDQDQPNGSRHEADAIGAATWCEQCWTSGAELR